jgi:hypothetical protein
MDVNETNKEPETERPGDPACNGKKADPPRPGPDYVQWRIEWEKKFGFKTQPRRERKYY